MYRDKLYFYEEILLLALKDEAGVTSVAYLEQSIAGAVLAELLLTERIVIENTKKKLVKVINPEPMNDPVLDVCFDKIKARKKGLSMQDWVAQLMGISKLFHTAAQQLCERGILKADKDKVLLFFTRRIYPEINPIPEKRLISELQMAIFSESRDVEPRTVVLISLAQSSGLLKIIFGRKEIAARKDRIESIVAGDMSGKAVKEAIAAYVTAAAIAIIIPTVLIVT